MEAEGIHSSKRLRDKDEEDGDAKGVGGLRPWQNASSRIIRVSRISGGKDRHSKVLTTKGLRDRRVRLSVSTAIQFYDLQDRLGYDQPSKAVDWLIKAADAAIADLPELDGAFPLPPTVILPVRPHHQEKSAAGEQKISLSKSTCSSTSETSKGSTLSLSRCQARERAQDRTAKEKENDHDSNHQHQNIMTPSSFTELLNAGPTSEVADCGTDFGQKQLRPPLATSTADYFGQAGIFGQSYRIPHLAPGCSSLMHVGNSPHMGMGMMAYNSATTGESQEMQQFSFMQDHVIPVSAVAPGVDYDLNVSISSVFSGLNRGTLQSNSLHHHHHLVDGTNLPFFFGAALPIAAAEGASSENQFLGGFNGRLQVCCNDSHRHPKLKGEGKG